MADSELKEIQVFLQNIESERFASSTDCASTTTSNSTIVAGSTSAEGNNILQ